MDRGLVESRARAQALVLAGRVRVGEGDGARRDLKPGDLVADAVPIRVAAGPDHASRGGDNDSVSERNYSVFIPLTTAQTLFKADEKVDVLSVQLNAIEDMPAFVFISTWANILVYSNSSEELSILTPARSLLPNFFI